MGIKKEDFRGKFAIAIAKTPIARYS